MIRPHKQRTLLDFFSAPQSKRHAAEATRRHESHETPAHGSHTEGSHTEGSHTEGSHTEGSHTEGSHTEEHAPAAPMSNVQRRSRPAPPARSISIDHIPVHSARSSGLTRSATTHPDAPDFALARVVEHAAATERETEEVFADNSLTDERDGERMNRHRERLKACLARRIKVVHEQVVCGAHTPKEKILRICKGDLTEETTDCIVNAANGQLMHYGGLAYAISRKAGPQLDRESKEYVKTHGAVPTGKATVTTAGNLPCKRVIHTVGPIYKNGREKEALLLRNACRSSLLLANQEKTFSISIPAISSGIFGFPKDECATILVDECTNWLRSNKESKLHVVHLTNIDDETVSHFSAAFKEKFST